MTKADNMARPKVLQIGFNKTGTTSLTKFFKKNGYTTAGPGKTAIRMVNNIKQGIDPFDGMEDIDLFQDQEYIPHKVFAWRFYKEIYHLRPDTYFILTTRACESWIQSRLRHAGGNYARISMKHAGVKSIEEMIHLWRLDYYSYHRDVIDFFQSKERFYIHSLETISVPDLATFLKDDYSLDIDIVYPWHRTRIRTSTLDKPGIR